MYLERRRKMPRYAVGVIVFVLLAPSALAEDEADALEDPRQAQIAANIAQYQQDLIGLGGVYSRVTTELNLSLADAYLELDDFDRALEAYGEALQSVRISNGLYSEEQLPLLELFATGSMRAQDWEKTENNLHLAYSLAKQLYEADDPRYSETASRYADWKVRAYQGSLLSPRERNPLNESIEIYDSIVASLSHDSENYHNELINILSAKGLAHYYSALYVDDAELEDFSRIGAATVNQRICRSRPRTINGVTTYVTVCNDERAPNPDYFESRNRAKSRQLESNLRYMRESYQQIVEILSEEAEITPLEIVEAMLNLGDINLLINDLERANSEYSRAFQLLESENVSQSVRNQVFNRPRKALEDVLARFNQDEFDDIALSGVVTFSVSSEGKIANARISGEESDLADPNRSLVISKLQSSFYRPAIVDGVAVDSELSIPASEL